MFYVHVKGCSRDRISSSQSYPFLHDTQSPLKFRQQEKQVEEDLHGPRFSSVSDTPVGIYHPLAHNAPLHFLTSEDGVFYYVFLLNPMTRSMPARSVRVQRVSKPDC